jgi:hypothetical protein
MPASAFITAVAPNFDSLLTAVPTVDTLVPNATNVLPVWLGGIRFANTGGVQRTVRVTDGAGNIIVPDMPISGNAILKPDVGGGDLEPIVGLRWSASGAGIEGHIWGFQ